MVLPAPAILNFDAGVSIPDELPDRPAVFLVWPSSGAPYLARTNVLRRRLRRLLGERDRPSRLLNLREVAGRVEYWLTGSRLESNLLFYSLAVEHFPDTYQKIVKLPLPHYVKVLAGNPFPRTQVTSRLGGSSSIHYGPFRSRASAEEFEKQALGLFQVRRCQADLEPSPEHPGCIYGEMNLCMRPCQEAVTAEEYRTESNRLVQFLATEGRSLIEPLEASRDRLSEELDFEAAARQHQQIERIQQVVRLRDELVTDASRRAGVAVTAAVEAGVVNLWFMLGGGWLDPVRFGFEVVEGRTISIDHRLRDIVGGLTAPRTAARDRQTHLALLARWYYSSWCDGEWLGFDDLEHVPYRRLVRAISRIASGEGPSDADSAGLGKRALPAARGAQGSPGVKRT